MDNETRLYADLAGQSVPFEKVEHVAVFTVAQSQAIDRDIPGAHTKNLFLKDGDGLFWLVTVPAEARVDLKALPAMLGSKRLSFGSEADMVRLIGVAPGSVTALAGIATQPGSVSFVLDQSLADAPRVNCHPLRNTATIGLSGADLCRMLAHWGHAPKVLSVPLRAD